MKVFLLSLVTLLVLVVGVCHAIPVKNIEQFVLGFADGVEVQMNGNVTVCVADSGVTFDDFEAGFEDLKNGFENKSLSLISQGLQEFGAGVNEVSLVLNACDMGEIAADIAAIAKEIMSGPSGILDVILKEVINIFHNGHDLTADFKEAISAWKSGDFFDSGKATGEITGVLLEE